MKPSIIPQVLDLAVDVRKNDKIFNPLFSGDPGLGKSEICQAWVAEKRKDNPDYGFIDLRLAYLDAPDLIGLTKIMEINGESRTETVLPSFWPTTGEGLLLLEEPNRANSSIMNALMQVLTDRKVHGYKLPDGWVVASCINQDNGNFDVNTMDSALLNRFEIFNIEYDQKAFIDYATESKWDEQVLSYIKSGTWIYKSVDEIGEDGTYISPRSWSKINAAMNAGVKDNADLFFQLTASVLGKHEGRQYHKFVAEQRPITVDDLIGKGKRTAFATLKKYADPNAYRGDLIGITVESVIGRYGDKGVDDKLMFKLLEVIPTDLGVRMLKESLTKFNKEIMDNERKGTKITMKEMFKSMPKEIRESVTSRLKGSLRDDNTND